ncbi:MAG: hypothetical protein LLG37_04640 [Spirochaetia bacterium]|nr:hypothetical protein [Spirochaetia bacterium]
MLDEKKTVRIKELMAREECLGIICYYKHHNQKSMNSARVSELLKIPVNKIKEACVKMEELDILKMHKLGEDFEIEMLDNENESIKHAIDEIIWEQKNEYGRIYKKLITAELLDFMEDR